MVVKFYRDDDTDMLKIESANYYFEQNVCDFSIGEVIRLLKSLGHETSLEDYQYDE